MHFACVPSSLQFKVSYYVIYYIEQDYHFKFQDYRINGKVSMAERKQYSEHKYTYNVHVVCCNVQLILCWSVIGASWLDYCVGRCSLAPGDGEHCSRGICRYPRRPPIVTTYMQATHPRQTAIPRTTYLLTRTRYNFERAKRRKKESREVTCSPWEYFMVINDHTVLLLFFLLRVFLHRVPCKLREYKNRLKSRYERKAFLEVYPTKRKVIPKGLPRGKRETNAEARCRISYRWCRYY